MYYTTLRYIHSLQCKQAYVLYMHYFFVRHVHGPSWQQKSNLVNLFRISFGFWAALLLALTVICIAQEKHKHTNTKASTERRLVRYGKCMYIYVRKYTRSWMLFCRTLCTINPFARNESMRAQMRSAGCAAAAAASHYPDDTGVEGWFFMHTKLYRFFFVVFPRARG